VVLEELARIIAGRKAQLATARAEGAAAASSGQATLPARIRGIFGFEKG
jgi:hypothetical protein